MAINSGLSWLWWDRGQERAGVREGTTSHGLVAVAAEPGSSLAWLSWMEVVRGGRGVLRMIEHKSRRYSYSIGRRLICCLIICQISCGDNQIAGQLDHCPFLIITCLISLLSLKTWLPRTWGNDNWRRFCAEAELNLWVQQLPSGKNTLLWICVMLYDQTTVSKNAGLWGGFHSWSYSVWEVAVSAETWMCRAFWMDHSRTYQCRYSVNRFWAHYDQTDPCPCGPSTNSSILAAHY
jgi:hypothetical protein